MNKSFFCTLSLFAGIALFSTVEISGKVIASHATVSPLPMVFARFFVTGLLLSLIGLLGYVKKKRLETGNDFSFLKLLTGRDISIFLLNGFLGIFGALYLFHLGIEMFENASSSAVVFSANALFTCVLAKFINKEELTTRKIVAVIIGLVGISCFIFEKGKPTLSTLLAILTMCGAAFLFAASVCITKRVVHKYGPIFFMGMSSLFGALITLPSAFIVNGGLQLDAIFQALPSMCYMVVVGTMLGYLFYYYGLSGVSAFKASMAFFMKPGLACIFAWLYLGNKMNLWTISGTLIIFLAMFLTLNMKKA